MCKILLKIISGFIRCSMPNSDEWFMGELDIGNGTIIRAKYQRIDNSEWRKGVAEYEIMNGIPISVYHADLDLNAIRAKYGLPPEPPAITPDQPPASISGTQQIRPRAHFTEEEKQKIRPLVKKAKDLMRRQNELMIRLLEMITEKDQSDLRDGTSES